MTANKLFAPIGSPCAEALPFVLISGPCSAESEEQVVQTARELCALGVHCYRASLWKPRTRPGGFEGVGSVGIPWLQRVRDELGMTVTSEVATPEHMEQMLSAGFDTFWIGARTTSSPFAMQEIAEALRGVDVTVWVKNPMHPDLELWEGALLRLLYAGVHRVGAIHRGFRTYARSSYRNPPLWQLPVELKRRHPGLTLLVDPSHIGGRRDLILPICQMGLQMRCDGFIIESHCDPSRALSDSLQQLTPSDLGVLLGKLRIPTTSVRESGDLIQWREQIDQIDDELLTLLAERMELCSKIGSYKRERELSILQPERYQYILDRMCRVGGDLGLREEFVHRLLLLIHEESVLQQEQSRQ